MSKGPAVVVKENSVTDANKSKPTMHWQGRWRLYQAISIGGKLIYVYPKTDLWGCMNLHTHLR